MIDIFARFVRSEEAGRFAFNETNHERAEEEEAANIFRDCETFFFSV